MGQLAGSLLGGSKPHNQQQQTSGQSSSSGGMFGGLLGGHGAVGLINSGICRCAANLPAEPAAGLRLLLQRVKPGKYI